MPENLNRPLNFPMDFPEIFPNFPGPDQQCRVGPPPASVPSTVQLSRGAVRHNVPMLGHRAGGAAHRAGAGRPAAPAEGPDGGPVPLIDPDPDQLITHFSDHSPNGYLSLFSIFSRIKFANFDAFNGSFENGYVGICDAKKGHIDKSNWKLQKKKCKKRSMIRMNHPFLISSLLYIFPAQNLPSLMEFLEH